MPFVKRYVEPRFVSRKELEAKLDDELEAVQVNTLASLIRQLGSVISYADEILGEFAETCTSFNIRLVSLSSRANRLREEVLPELDATEEVSVQEDLQILFPDGHFESEQVIEEQQMILQQLPKTTKDCYYGEAKPPPTLHIFTQLREDGENAMHFYSNPNFFFEYWRLSVHQKAEEEAKIFEIDVQEENNTNLVRGGSFRGSQLSIKRAEVLQMLSEGGDTKNGLFKLSRRRTVQPVRSCERERLGSQSSLQVTSAKHLGNELSQWSSNEGLQERSYSMPRLRVSSVRQGPPSKLQVATKSPREDTPQKDGTPDYNSSSNSPLTPLSAVVTPVLTTSRSSLASEPAKATSTTPVAVPAPTRPSPPQDDSPKPSPSRDIPPTTQKMSPLLTNGDHRGVVPYDEFDDNYTFQRSASMRVERSTNNAWSRSAKIRRSLGKKNGVKNGLSRFYFGDSQIARAAMELDSDKSEGVSKELSKSPPPAQSKTANASPKKRRFTSFKGKASLQEQQNDADANDTQLHRCSTLPSRPRGSFSKNPMFSMQPGQGNTRALSRGEASTVSLGEATTQSRSAKDTSPRNSYSTSQLERHSKHSHYTRIEPLSINHNSTWDSDHDGYGDHTHSTFGTLGRKPQRKTSVGSTRMATPRICVSNSPMRKNSTSRSPKLSNGSAPNGYNDGYNDGAFDLTAPENVIEEERYSKLYDSEKNRRSELLDQIRVGIELRKVKQKEELARKSSSNLPWNVSAILERRLVMQPPMDDDAMDNWSEDL